MNEVDNTDGAAKVPEIWEAKLHRARYSKEVLAQRVLRKDDVMAAFGDIVHLDVEASISLSSITATTGALVSNSNVTPTTVDLAVNQWYGANIDIVDRAQRQAMIDFKQLIARPAGEASAQHIDAALANEHSNITTNTQGDATTVMSPDLLLAAISDLDQLDVPTDMPSEIAFFLDFADKKYLKNLDKWDADKDGGSAFTFSKRPVGMVSGVPVFFSNQIKTSSSRRKNLLLHRECLAMAVQKTPEIEVFARSQWSTPVGFNIQYGIKTFRETHGVVLNTDSSS